MSYIDDVFSLKNKIAIVTGASRGNGKGISEALLRAGAIVFMVDILGEPLVESVSAFNSQGLEAYSIKLDLTEADASEYLANEVCKAKRKIDILVNNAGISIGSNIMEYSETDWTKTLYLNLTIPFLLSKAVARKMKNNVGGSIINITSLNAEMAFPDNPAYISAKGGLKMLGKSLALDLGKYNIRVNNIGPGYFRTAMTEKSWLNEEMRINRTSRTVLGRWGNSDKDLAGAVIFLASDASSYITGQDIYIDGGWLIKGL